jgi:hypothetical protein
MRKIVLSITIAIVTILAIIACSNIHKANALRLAELEVYKIKMKWFDTSMRTDIMNDFELETLLNEYRDNGYNGIYDPVAIKSIPIWEKEGIIGWYSGDIAKLEAAMVTIRTYIDPQLREDCEKLVYGGFDIFGIDTTDEMLRFLNAINNLNAEELDIDINTAWKMFMEGTMK